jgi:hypothetical protein
MGADALPVIGRVGESVTRHHDCIGISIRNLAVAVCGLRQIDYAHNMSALL